MNDDPRMTKLPPQSLENEEAVIGCMILKASIIPKVLTVVEAGDFYSNKNKTLFEAAVKEYHASGDLNSTLLKKRLNDEANLERVGGTEIISRCMASVPAQKSIMNYCEIVAQKSVMRQSIMLLNKYQQNAYNGADFDKYLNGLESEVVKLTREKAARACRSKFRTPTTRAHVLETLRMFQTQRDNKNKVVGVASGFELLDDITNGFDRSGVSVIGARPKIGKTSLACQLVANMAIAKQRPMIISMEMDGPALIRRMAAQMTGVAERKILMATTDDYESEQFYKTVEIISNLDMIIVDNAIREKDQLMSLTYHYAQTYKPTIIFVDNLQSISIPARCKPYEILQEYIKCQESFCKEYKIPIVDIAQIRRPERGLEKHKPQPHQLRDCGGIEQTAQLIILLHRPDQGRNAEIIVSYNRYGPPGVVKARFDGPTCAFVEKEFQEDEDDGE